MFDFLKKDVKQDEDKDILSEQAVGDDGAVENIEEYQS